MHEPCNAHRHQPSLRNDRLVQHPPSVQMAFFHPMPKDNLVVKRQNTYRLVQGGVPPPPCASMALSMRGDPVPLSLLCPHFLWSKI